MQVLLFLSPDGVPIMKVLFQPVPLVKTIPQIRADLAMLVLRAGLAAIFLYHGLTKILMPGHEWGANWLPSLIQGPPESFMRTPALTVGQILVAWGEVVGGVALAIGLLTRLAAIGEMIIQIGAAGLAFSHQVFSQSKAGGGEYNLALLAMLLTVICLGAGRCSVDWLLQAKPTPAAPPTTPVSPPPAETASAPGP
jgi:putative oxidoreductase